MIKLIKNQFNNYIGVKIIGTSAKFKLGHRPEFVSQEHGDPCDPSGIGSE